MASTDAPRPFRRPVLPRHSGEANDGDGLLQEPSSRPRLSGSRRSMRAVLALMLLTSLAASLYQLPVNRVIERRLCLEHYLTHDPSQIGPDGSVAEAACKINAVQQGLAKLLGVMETAWVVGDFVVAVPLGLAAERGWRRAVFYVNLVPRCALPAWALAVLLLEAVLPTRAIVAASFLSVLGGDCVMSSLTYSLAASLTDDAVQRATYFGYMSSLSYVVALMGPALSSATMTVALWLPLTLAVGLVVSASLAIRLLPETAPRGISEDVSRGIRDDEHADGDEDDRDGGDGQDDQDDAKPLLAGHLSSHLSALTSITALRHRSRSFGLLLVGFLLTSLASSDTKLLTQYISKRYAWTFAQAGYLLSCKAVVNFVLLAVVVPRWLRTRRHSSSPHASSLDNLFFARLCLGLSILGALAIAFSVSMALLVPALLVYALGSVLPIFTLSLLKSPAILPATSATASEAHIFAVVMLAKTLGSLVGAPLMATVWFWGMGVGGLVLGMPYFVSALCYLVALCIFAGITV